MNKLSSNYGQLLGLVCCFLFASSPLNAQQGNQSSSKNRVSAEDSNWQVNKGAPEPLDVLIDEPIVDVPAERAQGPRASVISDAQLRRDVDEAYTALNQALEEEDSFSSLLGEHYLAYGNILLRAGQPRDARKAFVSALHIQKVNNGIYDLQQRHILKSLFDTHYMLDEADKYEDVLRRILWLEDKSGSYVDDLTYDMMLKVGNANIDLFLRKPSANDIALGYLAKAERYLKYTVRKFGGVPLTEKKLPYGELALVSLLKSSRVPRALRPPERHFSGFNPKQQGGYIPISQHKKAAEFYAQQIHLGSDKELRQYLLKAKAENNQPELVHALLNLGDMAQLFQRTVLAHGYYQRAWENAQKLAIDDPLRTQMVNPVQLPAFNYAMDREHVERRLPTKLIPMSFDVQPSGRSAKVLPMADNSEHIKYYKAARRALRKLIFRPAIINGEVVRTSLTEHGVRVMYDPVEEKEKLEAKAANRKK